ncbi:MAG: hypothetical protein ABIS50_02615 [Luteolibacter sp.]|uniref:hypothetical protein n=1 Tax=Luteolibacter sp. TaxID=1962973 RepID=UPI003265B7E8
MKTRHIISTILLAISLPGSGMETTSDSHAETPPNSGAEAVDPRILQVQVEFVEMSHEALTKLLFLVEPKSSDATALRKQVQEMVAGKDAKVIETQLVSARNGQKATSESVAEVIYPTEYEPPELPGNFGSPGPSSAPVTSGATNLPSGPSTLTPTAFDTRNCGSTLETEATLSPDEKSVNLRLVPELVWHTGNTSWLDLKDSLGNDSKVQMPNFYTLRFNTVLSCVNGRYLMAAVLSPKDEKGVPDMSRKVMVFVKCDVLADQ